MPPVVPAPLGLIRPEIPTLVPEPPSGAGWIHEIKYDGYRTLIIINRGQVRAFTRNGNNWTTSYRRMVEACSGLACQTAVIDGEMVVQDEHGVTDFQALCSAIYRAPHRIVFLRSISSTSMARICGGHLSWSGARSSGT